MTVGPRRHIVNDFPAAQLPVELRGNLDPSRRVRVTVEALPVQEQGPHPRYRRFFGVAKDHEVSVEDAVSRIRALRDEWD